nr:MAG TPA: hypothetical protein [Caudoviricetes sp.]
MLDFLYFHLFLNNSFLSILLFLPFNHITSFLFSRSSQHFFRCLQYSLFLIYSLLFLSFVLYIVVV